MKKISILLFLFAMATVARAQQKVSASISITNATVNGLTFTVNGSTRTWTNNVLNTATMVLTNSDATGSGSKSNLLDQIRGNPFPQVTSADTGSNSFSLVGNANLAMAVSASGAYASISYSTQTVTTVYVAQLPVSSLPTPQARTNVASGIVGSANAVENTNTFSQISTAAAELLGTTNTQTISGQKTFSNSNSIWNGAVSQSLDTGNVLRGGSWSNGIMYRPTITNSPSINGKVQFLSGGVISNAFLGWGGGSFIDTSGVATFFQGVAINVGVSSGWSFFDPTLAGLLDLAVVPHGVGSPIYLAEFDTNSIFFFVPTTVQAPLTVKSNSVFAKDLTVNSNLNVGANATVTGNAVITGNFGVGGSVSNLTTAGPINVAANSDIAFAEKSITTLANGVNSGLAIGTNVVIVVSGPTGAFSINGIAGGRAGKIIVIKNKTGQTLTLANQSGIDPLPQNRIRTGSGADYVNANNPGCFTLEYDGADSRWDLVDANN